MIEKQAINCFLTDRILKANRPAMYEVWGTHLFLDSKAQIQVVKGNVGDSVTVPQVVLRAGEIENLAKQILLRAAKLNYSSKSFELENYFKSVDLPIAGFVMVDGHKIAVTDPEYLGGHTTWEGSNFHADNLIIGNVLGIVLVED